jgi:hypothetical protein
MPTNIQEHPDAPDLAELGEFVMEPVPRAEIEQRREDGQSLVEDNLSERDNLDVYVGLNRTSRGREEVQDIGNFLYRYTQLFGAPQCPEYLAGEDISNRTNETFKFLLRVTAPEETPYPPEWLVPVFDWKVRLGVGVAEWRDDAAATLTVDRDLALATIKLIHNAGVEPVRCEYEDIWY